MTATTPHPSNAPDPANPSALTIRALGEPIPQGSKSATVRGGRAVMFDDNPRLDRWRKTVTAAARSAAAAAGWQLLGTGPVTVDVTVAVARPASVSKRRTAPCVRPDLDKQVRAVLDALTDAGSVWRDDGQVCEITARKRYAEPGSSAGVVVTVAAL